MFNAGIVLSDDVCQLMLIRYGGPNLQMDFVSFVHLMLRVQKMEGEPVERRDAQGFLCPPRGWPACPQFRQEGGQQPVHKRQVQDPRGTLATCCLQLPKLICTLPGPEAKV